MNTSVTRPSSQTDAAPWHRRLRGARWPRLLLDGLWIGGFAASLALLLVRAQGTSRPGDAPLALELSAGAQRQGLYRKGERIGTVLQDVERRETGWRVSNTVQVGQVTATETVLDLRRDLSLERVRVELDVEHLGTISGLPGALRAGMRHLKSIRLKGRCALETGECDLRGNVGSHRVRQVVPAGRGPVVTSAIYPLLAQGSLGREAELRIFDPLSLGQRVVTYTVEGRERLKLHSGQFEAIRVRRDLESLNTRVWIDPQGRVLKEELPLGLWVEHEAWESS